MDIKYKIIEDKIEKYNSYIKSINWDKNQTYSLDNSIGIEWLIQKMVGAYDNGNLIGLGCINKRIKDLKIYAYLSCIVEEKYRRKGIADKLLRHMLDYCKELGIQIVRVEILKNNLPSVSQIEKNEFDFVNFDEKIITFEKKLINDK